MDLERLRALAHQPSRVVVGLNSGTSVDGIDALCVRLSGGGLELRVEPLAFLTVPYPAGIREQLLRAPQIELMTLTRLHREVAECFSRAAMTVADKAGVGPHGVDLIGSHGQTVCHLPGRGGSGGTATLQIGDLDILAERTGSVVVGDFRARDVAAGGEGAPLMPYLDWVLFRHQPRTLCLNLGGVANVTWVSAEIEGCRAFDTGPANLPLDLLAAKLTGDEEGYDPGGRLAAQGRVDRVLMDRLMAHPYLHRVPPKTTGREEFGQGFVSDLLARFPHLALKDILATCCAFVARSVEFGIREHWKIPGGARGVLVSGGGVHNLTLMQHLKKVFFPVPVASTSELGIDPDSKEALLFAVLANERILGYPSNVPSATGARWPVPLGKITL